MNRTQALARVAELFVTKPGVTATAEQDDEEYVVGLDVEGRSPVELGRGLSWDAAIEDAQTRWSKT